MEEEQTQELVPPPLPRHSEDEPGKVALAEFVNQRLDREAEAKVWRAMLRDSSSGSVMTWAERAAVEAGEAGNREPFDKLLAQRKPLSTSMREFILDALFPNQNRRERPVHRGMRDLKAARTSRNGVWGVYTDETERRCVVSFSADKLKDRVVVLVLVASDYRRIMNLFKQEYGSAYRRQYLAAELACRRWDFRDATGAWDVDGALTYISRGRKSGLRQRNR
jgi:hypothetical protein